MNSNPLSPHNYSDSSAKSIKEIRITSEDLATSFPESTRFDKPPPSLLPRSESQPTHTQTEDDFYPVNSCTLEPISNDPVFSTNRFKDDKRIHQNVQALANKRQRAEAPLQKQQQIEEYIEDLTAALHQRDEHIKQMNTSYHNLQRTFTNRLKDLGQRNTILERNSSNKSTIIKAMAVALILIAAMPFFFNAKTKAPEPIMQEIKPIVQELPKPIPDKVTAQKYYYTVKSNDTLSSISKRVYGDSKYANHIKKENQIDEKKLKPGTKLLITELELE